VSRPRAEKGDSRPGPIEARARALRRVTGRATGGKRRPGHLPCLGRCTRTDQDAALGGPPDESVGPSAPRSRRAGTERHPEQRAVMVQRGPRSQSPIAHAADARPPRPRPPRRRGAASGGPWPVVRTPASARAAARTRSGSAPPPARVCQTRQSHRQTRRLRHRPRSARPALRCRHRAAP